MLANLTYTFTLAHYSTTTLTYSLIADVALPVLLLLHIPAFFGKESENLLTYSFKDILRPKSCTDVFCG